MSTHHLQTLCAMKILLFLIAALLRLLIYCVAVYNFVSVWESYKHWDKDDFKKSMGKAEKQLTTAKDWQY